MLVVVDWRGGRGGEGSERKKRERERKRSSDATNEAEQASLALVVERMRLQLSPKQPLPGSLFRIQSARRDRGGDLRSVPRKIGHCGWMESVGRERCNLLLDVLGG